MRRYTVFHPLWMSFFSRQLYLEVLQRWRGMSFLYILLLSLIIMVPALLQVHRGVSEVIRGMPVILRQIPEVRIVGGVASTPETRPYFIRDEKTNRVAAIIDMSGRYRSLRDTEATILVTRTKLLLKKSAYEIREYSFSTINDLTINSRILQGWIDLFSTWYLLVLFPFILAGIYIYKLVAALLYSVIAVVVAAIMKVRISYISKLSLAIVAMTPSSLILAAFDAGSIPVPREFLLSVAVTTGFMVFGLYANRGEISRTD
ncbi:MAG: DUF1189 family protein [Spirochaetes bacterium]|nr:DUF1189 family protein [Spirochaetota bacterium]